MRVLGLPKWVDAVEKSIFDEPGFVTLPFQTMGSLSPPGTACLVSNCYAAQAIGLPAIGRHVWFASVLRF
jgi:hypothetical protein